MKVVSFQREVSDYLLQAMIVFCGEDISVIITGGDRPHIGAVALAVLTASIKDPEQIAMTPSLIAVPGHKEYNLALSAAQQLSIALERTVAVSVGIHINDISSELLAKIVAGYQEFIDDLEANLRIK